ncbi:hypothetical protein PFICI_04633 [Pestalotiopsis fici W106-1]|uniref:Uncharacterized protein n=1 Tax=Pestalotiopsis fici (strain W106-1 / CGMCC3.15140) TaxID=1229662 RepID=W3XBG4_PESFW|nr:uncharacterized protein PFICI_04633 [Pestalotiopsis fici W106-1]ETS82757.1 hypothetical protein PFICI_04633 [Pestalotiopsis fici W106-1]
MSAPPNAAPARGGSGQTNNHDHFGSFPSAQKSAYSTQSRVPSKRSDDDIQFISSQPVKKQKLAQTKLQIKITPPTTTGPSCRAIQPQQEHQSPFQHNGQVQTQVTPFAVPELQLTPAPVVTVAGNGGQPQNKTHAYASAQDRRISTGMVGLPPDFYDAEAANAMRGVSLPLATCLDNFVLNQPAGRPRPMSSPPLSPKQLCPTTPFSMLDATMSSPDGVSHHNTPQEASYIPRNPSMRPQGDIQMAAANHHQHTIFINQTMTPINSPSPATLKNMDIAMSNSYHITTYADYADDAASYQSPQWSQGSLSSLHRTESQSYDAETSSFANAYDGPELSGSPPQTPTSIRRDEMRQVTPSTPSPLPATTSASPAKSCSTSLTKHRKPARNLIVDIAETCHERFPFEDVAKRQNVTVAEVREVYDAVIGVPLLVSASDRRRAGELARSRKTEYRSIKKDIMKERAETAGRGAADGAKDDTVVIA